MEREIYIVGAHSRARTLGVYLTRLDPGTKIKAYIYDNDEPNADSIDGIPVKHFDENTLLETDFPVYLGTRGMYHAALSKEKLQTSSMSNSESMNSSNLNINLVK